MKTKSEIYLGTLAKNSFLSLWSFPFAFTDEGRKTPAQTGKELADLLVVFGDQVIIFSDKHCEYPTHADELIAWNRWYRKAIEKSVKQLVGAERWIREYPKRLYLDAKCQKPFPPLLANITAPAIHLVAITRGSSAACSKHFGNSSSSTYILNSSLSGDDHLEKPFQIGRLNNAGSWVHVFDETSLDFVMSELDTVSDFVRYLNERARFLSSKKVIVPGEEELLALYYENTNAVGHCLPDLSSVDADGVLYEEGGWSNRLADARFAQRAEVRKSSYAWDRLIEYFTQQMGHREIGGPRETPLSELEESLRVMATEDRFSRRVLSRSATEVFSRKLEAGSRFLRVSKPLETTGVVYVFAAFEAHAGQTDQPYRAARGEFLQAACLAAKAQWPKIEKVIGIAHQSASSTDSSFDLVGLFFEPEPLTEEELREVQALQDKWRILHTHTESAHQVDEFPNVAESNPESVAAINNRSYRKLSKKQRRTMRRRN
jgi:hypothetical protein